MCLGCVCAVSLFCAHIPSLLCPCPQAPATTPPREVFLARQLHLSTYGDLYAPCGPPMLSLCYALRLATSCFLGLGIIHSGGGGIMQGGCRGDVFTSDPLYTSPPVMCPRIISQADPVRSEAAAVLGHHLHARRPLFPHAPPPPSRSRSKRQVPTLGFGLEFGG